LEGACFDTSPSFELSKHVDLVSQQMYTSKADKILCGGEVANSSLEVFRRGKMKVRDTR